MKDSCFDYVFNTNWNYFVSLIVTSVNGCSVMLDITVTFVDPLMANFSAPATTSIHEPIDFLNYSTNATSWYWNFGDNSYSNLENPIHAFSSFISAS